MKGVCGIDINKDKTFISFAVINKSSFAPLREDEVDISFQEEFLYFLKKNSEALNEKIKEGEKKLSLKVNKIFLNLPWNMVNSRWVEGVVPLRRKK